MICAEVRNPVQHVSYLHYYSGGVGPLLQWLSCSVSEKRFQAQEGYPSVKTVARLFVQSLPSCGTTRILLQQHDYCKTGEHTQ